MISPLFPPLADPEAHCGGKFVRGLLDARVDVSVIYCSDVRTPLRLDDSPVWKRVQAVSSDVPNPPSVPFLKRCMNAVRYQSACWADWSRATLSKTKQLHQQMPFDLIISRSMPRQAQLAGFWAARALRIPWIAVLNDPWDFSPFLSNGHVEGKWSPGFNWSFWWRRIVARADRLCFPSERLRDACLAGSARKSGVLILPHIGATHSGPRAVDEFLIVHAGRLGINEPTGRSPIALLDALAELFRTRPAAKSRTRLLLVGEEDPETFQQLAARGLSGQVFSTGWVSYTRSLDYIGQAAVCVLVEGDFQEGVFLPSKLCDYIAARKPVLAFSPQVGTVADLSAAGGIRRVGPKDSAAAAAALIALFDAFLKSRLDAEAPPESLVKRFESRRVITDFLTSLRSLSVKTKCQRVPDGGGARHALDANHS